MKLKEIGKISFVVLAAVLFMWGCSEQQKQEEESSSLLSEVDVGTTISSLAEVRSVNAIRVEGYGLVGGLNGTGSSDCSENVRRYLRQYILKATENVAVDRLINDPNTAVVQLNAIMPAAVVRNKRFDVAVSAIPGTQTTSLENGWLYNAELKPTGRFSVNSRVLAKVKGPVFINKLGKNKPNLRRGYILDGGVVLDEYPISLAIRRPDYQVAGMIRDRLNGRFSGNIAKAVSDTKVILEIPQRYKNNKQRFVGLVRAMYLMDNQEIIDRRITMYIHQLAGAKDKYPAEMALEAIGTESLKKLRGLGQSSSEETRFCAARCMLYIGDELGFEILHRIAIDKESPYRLEAVDAIALGAVRSKAIGLLRVLLRDDDLDVRLKAYEHLRRRGDFFIDSETIGGSFALEHIRQTTTKAIYVSRSGQPRIALFGTPIKCTESTFIQSDDGKITINAPAGEDSVFVIRDHPARANVISKIESSYLLSDIIRAMCSSPISSAENNYTPGLGISYSDTIAMLQKMVEKGAIEAEFRAGPLPRRAY